MVKNRSAKETFGDTLSHSTLKIILDTVVIIVAFMLKLKML